ncbi:MAG: hypothetical protein ACK5IJ_06780 [Mangrovibacterium sp.]
MKNEIKDTIMKDLTLNYNRESNIYHMSWTGITKLDDIKWLWGEMYDRFDLEGGKHRFLLDGSNAYFDETISGCQKLARYFSEDADFLYKSRMAIVASTPHSIARVMYVINNVKGIHMKVFSTLNAANQWLM